MKVIVNCAESNATANLASGPASLMLTLVDRPFVQHVVEFLIDAGLPHIDLVVNRKNQSAIQTLFGDGARWGSRFAYEIVTGPRDFYSLLADGPWQSESSLVLANANRIPNWNIQEAVERGGEQPHLAIEQIGGKWSGWGVVPTIALDAAHAADDVSDESDLGGFLRLLPHEADPCPVMTAESWEQLLAAQRSALTGDFPGLFINGRERNQKGVRVCRNVKVHRSVQIEGPVFLGDNVRIAKGVTLGPNTVIGDNCIIDRNAIVSGSLVLPNSYVGEWLEVVDCVVSQSDLVNVRLGASLRVDDSLVLGSV